MYGKGTEFPGDPLGPTEIDRNSIHSELLELSHAIPQAKAASVPGKDQTY